MDKRPDRDLVAQARCGDREAFGQLVKRYQRMATLIAARLVHNEHIAEEMAQEAMLQAYLSLKHLRNDASFRSWLHGILRNVCMSYLRTRREVLFPVYDGDEGAQIESGYLPGAFQDPQAAAEKRELNHRVLEAVNALSPANRSAAFQFYFQQFSLREIASQAGVSVAAVKNRLYRARKHLTEILSPVYAELVHGTLDEIRGRTMVDVTIAGVMQRDEGVAFVTLLDNPGHRILAIQIEYQQGLAISHCLDVPRGGDAISTHEQSLPPEGDFISNLLEKAGVHVQEVRIETLNEKILLGVVKMKSGETVHELEARSSDVIALAARTGCPIRVNEEMLVKAGEKIPEELWDHPERMFPGKKMLSNAELTIPHIRALENVHEKFAELLAATVSKTTARKTDGCIAFVDTPSFGEYIDFLAENPGCTYGFTVGGMKGKGLLALPVKVAHELLGSAQPEKLSTLTGDEADRLEPVVRAVLEDLEATWEPLVSVSIQDIELLEDAKSAGIAALHSPVYLVGFEVSLPGDRVPITLCYPFATIFESALPPLMRSRFLPKGRWFGA